MSSIDEYAKGAMFGYRLAWLEAWRIADVQGSYGIKEAVNRRAASGYYLGVHPRDGGPLSLYCFDCGEWVPNTANSEMLKEKMFAHGHSCVTEGSFHPERARNG